MACVMRWSASPRLSTFCKLCRRLGSSMQSRIWIVTYPWVKRMPFRVMECLCGSGLRSAPENLCLRNCGHRREV